MPITVNHITQLIKVCLKKKRRWLYMELPTFLSEIDEKLEWGETPKNFVERLNTQVNKVHNRELNRGVYLHFMWVEQDNSIYWALHKTGGEYYFK
jgi:hypothetical protein